MITDPDSVVAQLRYPMRVDGLTKVMRGLSRLYDDDRLVIVTDGPLWREGWMTIARTTDGLDAIVAAEIATQRLAEGSA